MSTENKPSLSISIPDLTPPASLYSAFVGALAESRDASDIMSGYSLSRTDETRALRDLLRMSGAFSPTASEALIGIASTKGHDEYLDAAAHLERARAQFNGSLPKILEHLGGVVVNRPDELNNTNLAQAYVLAGAGVVFNPPLPEQSQAQG